MGVRTLTPPKLAPKNGDQMEQFLCGGLESYLYPIMFLMIIPERILGDFENFGILWLSKIALTYVQFLRK